MVDDKSLKFVSIVKISISGIGFKIVIFVKFEEMGEEFSRIMR